MACAIAGECLHPLSGRLPRLRHIVTIEHLAPKGAALHPVQRAMVDHHGSQCGFCTPGFVMALYGLWMGNADPSVEIETALQGNLRAARDYEPIVKAARAAAKAGGQAMDALAREREVVAAKLAAIPSGADVAKDGKRALLPADTDALAQALLDNPGATVIAGATDVGLWVTKFLRPIAPTRSSSGI